MSTSIWYNPLISKYPLFLPVLNKQSLNLVGDLLNSNGQIITREELINKTNLNTVNALNILRLKVGIQALLKNAG